MVNKELRGWIYYIKNTVNGKMYIGKTNNFNRRKREHFNRSTEGCPQLQRAFKKYGKDSFIMNPIITFKTDSILTLNNILNSLEKYYINFYNTFHNGYNTTLGGEGLCGHIFTEEHRKNLSNSMKGKVVADSTKEKLRILAKNQDHTWKNKPILQYSLDGIFIREFPSRKEAIKSLALSSPIHIEEGKSHGYIWRYKENNNFPFSITPYKHCTSKKVYHYDKNHELLGVYESPEQAFRKTGVKVETILASVHIPHKNARSNYWSYKKETA